MIIQSEYSLEINEGFDATYLNKDNWLVILHASRIPPHIGVLIEGNYNSLTIKGHELNISVQALLKTIQQKKIEVLFVKLKHHPVFSFDYQKEVCQIFIKKYQHVKQNEATCLTPIKQYLQEFYAVPIIQDELLYELIERLKQNSYIVNTYGLNLTISNHEFSLPVYTQDELQNVIQKERAPYYKD